VLEGKPISGVARDLDLTRSALNGWIIQARVDGGKGAAGALPTAEKEELSPCARRSASSGWSETS
jgi:transposase